MAIETLKTLFTLDLKRLKKEVELYQDERNLWKVDGNIINCGGNLCLHLIGNLNAFIGKEIGQTGYVRDRPAEFALKDVPRSSILKQIDDTIEVIQQSLDQLEEEDLKEDYPAQVFNKITSMEYMLIHLATHLGYHLGQVNYHRRLLDH